MAGRTLAQGVAGHRRRGGHVEGVDAAGHGDPHDDVGLGQPVRAQPAALGAHEQRHLARLGRQVGGELVEGHVVGAQGHRRDGEARPLEGLQASGPVVHAGPGQEEDGAHARLDGPPVERVGGPRGEQHAVPAEGGGAPDDGADVRVVDDVLAHDEAPRVEQFGHAPAGGALHRGERPAVHVEAGDPLGQGLVHDVDGHVEAVEDRAQPGDPALGQQEGPRLVAGLAGPPDHLLALGDEQAVGGLKGSAQ